MDKLLKIVKGYLISNLVFLTIMLVISVIAANTNMPMSGAGIYGCAALSAASLLFGISAGAAFQKRGLLTGLGFGIMYVCLFIFLITTMFDESFYAGITDMRYVVPVLFCTVGGVLGTNLKN